MGQSRVGARWWPEQGLRRDLRRGTALEGLVEEARSSGVRNNEQHEKRSHYVLALVLGPAQLSRGT